MLGHWCCLGEREANPENRAFPLLIRKLAIALSIIEIIKSAKKRFSLVNGPESTHPLPSPLGLTTAFGV